VHMPEPTPPQQDQWQEWFIDPSVPNYQPRVKGYQDHICMNQQTLQYVGGALFFSYIGSKIFSSVKKGKKAQKNIKKVNLLVCH